MDQIEFFFFEQFSAFIKITPSILLMHSLYKISNRVNLNQACLQKLCKNQGTNGKNNTNKGSSNTKQNFNIS